MSRSASRTPLRLLQGGLQVGQGDGGLTVHLASSGETREAVDALVVEEDTHLILSAPATLSDEPEHPIHVMTALAYATRARPGCVVVRGRSTPYRFLAVVHDIDQSPTWRWQWIAEALTAVFEAAEQRALNSLALPVLGAKHGSVSGIDFAILLSQALAQREGRSLETLWLLLPPLAPSERRAIERALLS